MTPLPLHSGQAMPIWAAMALRMKALLLGNLLSSSASSFSTLKATTAVFGSLRAMGTPSADDGDHTSSLRAPRGFRKHGSARLPFTAAPPPATLGAYALPH